MQKVFYCLIILALFSCGEKKLGPIPDLTSLTQSNFVFPYLRVVNGQLSADPSGEFSGNEVPVKLIGAVISNAVSGTNGPKYYKYDNGTSTDYHDSFWTRTAKMSDPHAFLDLVVADLLDAGLNSTRVVLNYCETGGGSVGNGVVGCAVAFDQTQFTRIISLIQYFVGKAQEAGIVVDIDLFDQFTMGSDDAENRVWMSALIEAFKDYRNVIWGLQNEPVARVWRDTIPNNVVAKLATTVSWYDMTADYMRTNDVDSQGRRRHMIGLEDIHASVLDAVTISKYDIAFMHHGNRTAAPGGYLDAVIYKAREKNVNLSIILNELACTDTGATGICRTDEALNEYFKVSIRSINNRLLKKFGSANGGGTNVSVDGGMVWTMYDSCEEITSGVCDIAAGDADHQRSWGVFSCLPDQTCTNRKRSGAVTELAGISFKTNFKALVAPTLEGTLVRGAGTSKNLWDVTLLGPISNNIAANVWNYWAVNPAHFDFDAYTVSAANDSLKLSNYARPYCWGDRQTGPLQFDGNPYTDDLSDSIDVFLKFDLLDKNGTSNPIKNGIVVIDLVRDNDSALPYAPSLWGNDIVGLGDNIPDLSFKRLNMEEFLPGHFEFNLSQIMRDEGMTGTQLIGLNFGFYEKTNALYPGNNASCTDITGYGGSDADAAAVFKEIKLESHTMTYQ